MPLPLFRLPSLVYEMILKQLPLVQIFKMAVLSKRARAIIRRCLASQKFLLEVSTDDHFWISTVGRQDANEAHGLTIEIHNFDELEKVEHQFQNFLGFDSMAMRDGFRTVNLFCPDRKKLFHPALEFLAGTFSIVNTVFSYATSDCKSFTETLRLVRKWNIPLKKVHLGNYVNPNNSLITALLRECWDASTLIIAVSSTPKFKYGYRKALEVNSLTIDDPRWVTRNHVIHMFINCKKVDLSEKKFSQRDFTAIFERWIQGTRMKLLQLGFQGKELSGVFKNFEGAIPVRSAELKILWSTKQMIRYREGQCFMIKQNDGSAAIVTLCKGLVTLTTDFDLEKVNQAGYWNFADERGMDVDHDMRDSDEE